MINNKGFIPILIIIGTGILIALAAYFGINQMNNPNTSPSPSPSVVSISTETAKQKLYEANKEKIKADLNMTEEEFQILKRFSED